MHLDALLLAASERLGEPFSLTVHLGAGRSAPDLYAPLSCLRLVLVEGEPAVAEELRNRCAVMLPAAEIAQVVIAPVTGPVTWHQYNLRSLSGPAESLAFRAWYPRLEQTGVRQVQAVALPAWLEGLPATAAPGLEESLARTASSLLVFDLPGQESALLDGMSDESLRRFGWIIVRRWRQVGAARAGAAHERLARAGFDCVLPTGAEAEAQIVQELYRLDERHEQLRRLAEDCADMRARMSGLEQTLAATEASVRDADGRVLQAEASLHDSQLREAEQATRIAVLEAQQAAHSASAERHAHATREVEARAAQLDAERTELRQRSGELRENLKTAEASLVSLSRKHQEAEALAKSRALELEVAQKQLADERKAGRTQAQRIEKLEAELLDAQFRLETLQHELLKAEGQLEVVKDLLLNEVTL